MTCNGHAFVHHHAIEDAWPHGSLDPSLCAEPNNESLPSIRAFNAWIESSRADLSKRSVFARLHPAHYHHRLKLPPGDGSYWVGAAAYMCVHLAAIGYNVSELSVSCNSRSC